ncbi:hypothetical protein [Moritella sp.]|uniref:hypothetical protein n=1 Tax=Moritella sp. TaxID=78556 RepID=UPI001DE6B2EC|nr:hypothetical protein [Moritella sp.]MCJ8349187.1 hypothetical protein [Moritella sp.]NQZ39475.1 hypothetical protein [Moritella sp.]
MITENLFLKKFNLQAQQPAPIEISIPSVRDTKDGFYNLWHRLFFVEWDVSKKYHITLTFSSCNYAGVNLTALLGAFVCFVRRKLTNSQIHIETKTMNSQVYLKLKNMELLSTFAQYDVPGYNVKTDDIIPYREFLASTKEDEVLSYLERDWLGKNRLNFSEDVKNSVLSSLWEIYANAFEHSNTFQVNCCGSYDSKNNTLTLLVGDSGRGIVNCIKEYLDSDIPSTEALKWALIKGNSTYTANLRETGETQPRGLGFHLLTQLVDLNGGSMEIYTDNIYYLRHEQKDLYDTISYSIKGSWIRLTLQCKKDVLYYFTNEKIPEYF